jgi:16S rRNA (uracil1498-N3)-methyltransferase
MSQTPDPHGEQGSDAIGAWMFADAIPAAGTTHWLSRDEARHAAGSRRLRPGDPLTLFDGQGTVAHATLGNARRDDGALEVLVVAHHHVPREGRHVTLASAVPKGDRLATLMEGIGPLGVAAFVPLRTERGVVPWSGHLAQRSRRILMECAKQSHSPWVTAVPDAAGGAPDVPSVVSEAAGHGARVMIADQSGAPLAHVAAGVPADARVRVLVGPEGGFSGRERDAAVAAGAVPVSLGPAILRIELAATVAAALLRLR